MTLEHHKMQHKDGTDHVDAKPRSSAGNLGLDMTSPHFNRQHLDTTKPTTAQIHDLTITNSDNIDKNFGSSPPVRNIDASSNFHKQVTDSFRQSLGRLNPETQSKLKDSTVLTVDHTRKAMPNMPDIPAVTPDKSERKGNTMIFSERGVNNQKAPVKDVMNHEIFHAIDNATGASKTPELRRAIDNGIRQLSPADQHHIAVMGKDQAAQRYAEFAGDVMALEMGSKPKDLAYLSKVHNSENSFKEARELIRKRYLQEK